MAWRRHLVNCRSSSDEGFVGLEPVMSTDQVLSLIDGSSRGVSRNCSMTALAALDEPAASDICF
jgi:hypothetical protein